MVAAADTQDNRVECELSAWGVVEVGSAEDASEREGMGPHEFRGLAYDGKLVQASTVGAGPDRRFPGDPGSPELWNEVAQFVETPYPHASGPMLRPVTVGIDSGGHYADAVAEFVKAGGPAYQCIKGLGRHRFDGFLARRSVTSDVLDRYGANGLLLIGGNECEGQRLLACCGRAIAGAEPRPMVWPKDESRYGVEEFDAASSLRRWCASWTKGPAAQRWSGRRSAARTRRWTCSATRSPSSTTLASVPAERSRRNQERP